MLGQRLIGTTRPRCLDSTTGQSTASRGECKLAPRHRRAWLIPAAGQSQERIASGEHALLVRDCDGGRPVRDAEFVVDVEQVRLDGGLADVELGCDGGIGVPRGDTA